MRLLVTLLLLWAGAARAEDLSAFAFRQHPGAALPGGVVLRDEAGRDVTLRAASGGLPLLLVPGYFHCPNLCGVVRDDALSALSRTTLRPGRDYALVMLSIDPAETAADAAAARADGLRRYPVAGAAAGWHYLTGPADSLRAIEDAVGFRARYDFGLRQFLHPAGVVVADAGGILRGYVLGVGYAPADLAASVADARVGASRWAAPILLLCFHFDEARGRYTPSVMKILRLAGGLTVVALGTTLFMAHRGRAA